METIIKILLTMSVGVFGAVGKSNENAVAVSKSNLSSQASTVVLGALASSDPYYRVRGIEVVAESKTAELMPMVEKLLGDDYRPVRFAAALAVGDMRYYQAKGKLKKLIELADDNTKIAAAYGLAKMGDKSHIVLIRKALKSNDQNIKANAAMLLGKLADVKSVKDLQNVFIDQKASDAAMFQAAEAIAKIYNYCIDSRGSISDHAKNYENITPQSYRGIYQRLWTLLISKHPDDRKFGVGAMAALGTSEAKQAILTMLYDENLEVRLIAAMELGKMGDDSGQNDVVDALTKPLEQIDVEAMQRAYEYGQKKKQADNTEDQENVEKKPVFRPVNRTTKEYEQTQQRAKTLSALAIGYIKTDDVTKFLPELINDGSKEVSLAAAQSVLSLDK